MRRWGDEGDMCRRRFVEVLRTCGSARITDTSLTNVLCSSKLATSSPPVHKIGYFQLSFSPDPVSMLIKQSISFHLRSLGNSDHFLFAASRNISITCSHFLCLITTSLTTRKFDHWLHTSWKKSKNSTSSLTRDDVIFTSQHPRSTITITLATNTDELNPRLMPDSPARSNEKWRTPNAITRKDSHHGEGSSIIAS